eukprot:289007_1
MYHIEFLADDVQPSIFFFYYKFPFHIMLSFLTTITVLLSITISQSPIDSCDYGWFTKDYDTNSATYDQCIYSCYDWSSTSNDPIPILTSTLTFEQIASKSSDISDAITQYGAQSCSSLNDLVWSSGCDPYCICNTQTSDVINTQTYFKKSCTECTCMTQDYTNDISGWDCSEKYSVDTASQWNSYTCTYPVTTCTGPIDSSTRDPGEGWFVSTTYDTTCQTYCYCNFDGVATCENSYANILSSTNTDLKNAFKMDCDYDAAGCFGETNLMFSDSTSWCSCPKCNCPPGSNNDGDIFYKEYTDPTRSFSDSGDPYDTTCMKCTCMDDGSGNLSQDCPTCCEDSYPQGSETCPQTPQGTCKVGSGISSSKNEANGGFGVMSQQCYGEVNKNCGWTYMPNEGDTPYSWQCQNSMFCQAFTQNGNGCVHLKIDTPFNIMCESENGVVSFDGLEQYTMCCSTDDCNDENIDILQCNEDPTANQWYTDYLQCKFGSLYREFFCAEIDTYSCEDIKRLGTWYFGCDCSAFGDIYNRASTEFQSYLESDIAARFSALDEWNTLFECGNTLFECDLSSGVMSINGVSQNSVTATPTQNPVTYQPSTGTPTSDTNNPSSVPSGSPTIPTTNPSTRIPTITTGNPTETDHCALIEVLEPWFQEKEEELCDYCYKNEKQERVCSRMVDVIKGTTHWIGDFVQDCFLRYCELDCEFDAVGVVASSQQKKDCSCDMFDCNGVVNPGSGANELKVFIGIGIGLIVTIRLWM